MITTTYYSNYVDEFGNNIERTPHTDQFNYQGFVTHRFGANRDANLTIYSDRLLREGGEGHHQKVRDLMQKHFGEQGDYWSQRDPKDIETFLCEYLKKPNLKIVLIMQYCNQSSSYPYWRFDVNTGG